MIITDFLNFFFFLHKYCSLLKSIGCDKNVKKGTVKKINKDHF